MTKSLADIASELNDVIQPNLTSDEALVNAMGALAGLYFAMCLGLAKTKADILDLGPDQRDEYVDKMALEIAKGGIDAALDDFHDMKTEDGGNVGLH